MPRRRGRERPRAGLSEWLLLAGCVPGGEGRPQGGAVLGLRGPRAVGHKDLAQWPCCSPRVPRGQPRRQVGGGRSSQAERHTIEEENSVLWKLLEALPGQSRTFS